MDDQSVPTVRVVASVTDDNKDGYIVINKADLADHHEVYSDKPKPKPETAKGK